MKTPFVLGVVGHFGLAVRNPKKSARWFQRTLGLRKQFDFKDGIAVGNDHITIALSVVSRSRRLPLGAIGSKR